MLRVILALSLFVTTISCTIEKAELGTKDNPIKLFFVPSVDAKLIADRSKIVERYLEENTGYEFDIRIPSSFVAVVEAFGTKRADIAVINTFGYILANEKYGAEALITFIRHGHSKYRAQIVARSDSDINKAEDINGKKFAFVDPSSTSGYLLPMKVFADRKIKPSETVFAQKHDNVIMMVYQKQVDAGATFYSPRNPDGGLEDARRLVKTQYPDIEEKVKIVELTDQIPNDPIIFRKDLSSDMKTKIQASLLEFIKTEEGQDAFKALYGVTKFLPSTDADYDSVREMLQSLGKEASSLVR